MKAMPADSSGIVDGQPEFYRFMVNYSRYHPLNEKLVFLYNLQAGITLNSQGFIFDDFYMGGIQQFIRQANEYLLDLTRDRSRQPL